jgi:hypothetical protein
LVPTPLISTAKLKHPRQVAIFSLAIGRIT